MRGRGLKLLRAPAAVDGQVVAPHAGAWIETYRHNQWGRHN